MDRKEMMAMKKDGCRKSESRKGSCRKADKEPPVCGKEEQPRKCNSEKPNPQQCSKQNETTCVCICCFQFAAPDQLGNKLQFGYTDIEQSLAVYFQQNWKDPQLALPWQPPDGV